MQPEPSDRDKVLAVTDWRELEGMQGQFRKEGRLSNELENLIALRMRILRGAK